MWLYLHRMRALVLLLSVAVATAAPPVPDFVSKQPAEQFNYSLQNKHHLFNNTYCVDNWLFSVRKYTVNDDAYVIRTADTGISKERLACMKALRGDVPKDTAIMRSCLQKDSFPENTVTEITSKLIQNNNVNKMNESAQYTAWKCFSVYANINVLVSAKIQIKLSKTEVYKINDVNCSIPIEFLVHL